MKDVDAKVYSTYYTTRKDNAWEKANPDEIQDIKRWWEVIDRTTREVGPVEDWSYDSAAGDVTIHGAKEFHDYTVSFDVRQPKNHEYSMKRLRKFSKYLSFSRNFGKEAALYAGSGGHNKQDIVLIALFVGVAHTRPLE